MANGVRKQWIARTDDALVSIDTFVQSLAAGGFALMAAGEIVAQALLRRATVLREWQLFFADHPVLLLPALDRTAVSR